MALRHNITLVAALVAAAFTVAPTAATAGDVAGFGTGGSKARVKDMKLLEGASGTFSDKYTVEAFFKGGGDFYFSISQRSFGVGSPEFVVQSRYRMKGEKYETKEHIKAGDWSQEAGKTIDIKLGRHRLQGTPKEWTITAEDDDKRFELTFKATAPPWRPGDGRAEFGSEYLDMTVLAPRAKVTGTLKVGDEVREVKGRGYALHSYSTMAPHETARRMVSFRTESGPLAFYVKEIVPAARWSSSDPIRWMVIARKGKVLLETTDFTITPGQVEVDAKHTNRYPVPHLFKIEAKDGDSTFTAVIQAKKQRERSDRLESMSKITRTVVAQFAKPVYYRFDAAYEARYTNGSGETEEFKGRGVYELDHVNK